MMFEEDTCSDWSGRYSGISVVGIKAYDQFFYMKITDEEITLTNIFNSVYSVSGLPHTPGSVALAVKCKDCEKFLLWESSSYMENVEAIARITGHSEMTALKYRCQRYPDGKKRRRILKFQGPSFNHLSSYDYFFDEQNKLTVVKKGKDVAPGLKEIPIQAIQEIVSLNTYTYIGSVLG